MPTSIPLRLCVPSGRLAGPIWKPFFCFFTSLAESPSCARFSAMLAICGVSLFSCTRQCTGKESAIERNFSSLGIVIDKKEPRTTTHSVRNAAAETKRPLCALWTLSGRFLYRGSFAEGSNDRFSSCDLPAAARPPAKTGLAAALLFISAR